MKIGYILGCLPAQDASHHQDHDILLGDPYKPSFVTVTGRGDKPSYILRNASNNLKYVFIFRGPNALGKLK